MLNRKLYDEVAVVSTIKPQALAADATVAGDDVQVDSAYNPQGVLIVIHAGAWTDGTHTFEVQEAADDGAGAPDTYAAVAAANLIGTEPVVDGAGDDDQTYVLAYTGLQPWLRVSVTSASTTGGMLAAAEILLGDPTRKPVR